MIGGDPIIGKAFLFSIFCNCWAFPGGHDP